MGMKNHPNDTICKRLMARGKIGAKAWLTRAAPEAAPEGLSKWLNSLLTAGALEASVGEIERDEVTGTEKLLSVIVALPSDDNRIKKVTKLIVAYETELGVEQPGDGIGNTYALISCSAC